MTEHRHAAYRLGLDLGTNSIGWAAIRLDDSGEPFGILDMGVRVFPDGRDAKSKESNAKTRRIARGARRRRDRYQKRRADLLKTLVEYGLMPDDKRERQALAGRHDPYELRARALDDPLHPHELGRALFHLNQRRGFKSNRKADQDSDGESGIIKQAAEALTDEMTASDARTLGEFLYWQRCAGQPTRFRNLGTGTTAKYKFYPTRQMLEEEFDEIRTAQVPHQDDLRHDQWDSLKDTILFQRRLRSVDPGLCQFEAGEPRAARALPVAQEFRMLQEVNNLRVRVGIEPERELCPDERQRALDLLRSGKKIELRKGKENTPAKPRRNLKLPSDAVLNLSRGGRKAIEADETAVRLMKRGKRKERPAQEIFGAQWLEFPLDARNEIVRFMLCTEDPENVRRKASADWGLDNAQAKALSEAILPSGYSNLSEKSIRKLLPHLERGLVFSDAVQAAGYKHHSDFRCDQAHDYLPYYGAVLERDAIGADPNKDPKIDGEPARYGRFPNPTVHIGLNQLRRVVNRLIEVYGKPKEIVVELARDLKWNRERKEHDQWQREKNEERNQQFKEMLQSAGEPVKSHVLRKLRLWSEQGPPQARFCPYTGRTISCAMAMDSRTEIDHILPFSRTLDDSMSNKVVCMTGANRHKGNQSPWEAFHHDSAEYDEILARAAALPGNKSWRFKSDAMQRFEEEERDFLDRQLDETRYLSRTARAYLAHLYDEKTEGQRVRAIPGQMTSILRRGWGLEGMLRVTPAGEIVRKQRDDHRHHAIDAFVVANTTQGLLQRFAQASTSRRREAAERLAAIAGDVRPWDGFSREDLRPFLDRLTVSYKPDHGTRGQHGRTTGRLHNDTAYGIDNYVEDGQSTVVVRKKLLAGANGWPKTRKHLESVRNESLQEALLELWDQVKSDGGNVAKFIEQAANPGVPMGGRLQIVRRVRILDEQRVIPIWSDKSRTEKPYKGYLPGGNEFADIWRMRDGRWRMIVVPTFDANQSSFDIEMYRPADKKTGKPDPAAKRLMRLYKNDMGALGDGADLRIVRIGQFWATERMVLSEHNEADPKEKSYVASKLQSLGFRKVGVDEIGRVRDPGPP
jgi:CRISPR-associated endonuclease Csn1